MKKTLFIIFCFCCNCGFASNHDTLKGDKFRYVSLDYQNDYFNATDYYFTQGVRIDIIAPIFRKSPLSKILLRAGKNSVDVHGIFASQECFTPTSIRSDSILTGDRPFAACIFVGQSRISSNIEKKYSLMSEIIFGFIGSRGGCMETQQTIHGWINGIDPHGWEYQISDDFIINYSSKYEKLVVAKKSFEFIPYLNIRAGTLYDNASAGIKIRTGIMNSFFDANIKSAKKFLCYAELWGQTTGVAYNATLQGGLFNKQTPYVILNDEMERILFSVGGKIVLNYKKLSLVYSRNWITPEFKKGLKHGWGGIAIKVNF